MDKRANERTVRQLFACFAQGDIAGALALLTDDVQWQVAGPPAVVPWAGPRQGREQVARLLTVRPETLETQHFEPRELIARDDTVVVLGHEQARVKPTERICQIDLALVFTLRDGKITRLREYGDTAVWVAAYGAPAPT